MNPTIEASPMELVPANQSPVVPAPALPSGAVDRWSSNGKLLGTRYMFGSYSARDLKESIKTQRGLKGKALTKAVNEALKDETASRRVVLGAAVAELGNRGFVPDIMDVKDSKNATIKFIHVEALAAKKATADEMLEALSGGDASKLAALKSIMEASAPKPAIESK